MTGSVGQFMRRLRYTLRWWIDSPYRLRVCWAMTDQESLGRYLHDVEGRVS